MVPYVYQKHSRYGMDPLNTGIYYLEQIYKGEKKFYKVLKEETIEMEFLPKYLIFMSKESVMDNLNHELKWHLLTLLDHK